MTVKVTKPALNLREELSSLKKPSGVAGEAMLRAETPQEQFNLIGAGRKNLIINGGFDVWQRGTSSSSKGGYYTADRWRFDSSGSTTSTAKATDSELGNVLTSSSDTVSNLQSQYIEDGGRLLYGKKCTLSFWVKADDACTGNMRLRNNTTATNLEDATYPVTTDWTYVTHTFDAYTSWSITDVARLYITNNTSVATKLYFAQVQLELGSVATPFEHRSYGEELALCQRYYYRINAEVSYGRIASCFGAAPTAGFAIAPFPVQMRATPSLEWDGDFIMYDGTNKDVTISGTSWANTSIGSIGFSDSGGTLTGGNGGQLTAKNDSAAYVAFKAEL